MNRERALKIVLVVVGLLFTIIPLTMFFSREPAVPMIMSCPSSKLHALAESMILRKLRLAGIR
jgi:hypothetical protein